MTKQERERVAWGYDGATPQNPHPNWWDAHRLDETGGRPVHTCSPGGVEQHELVDDPGRPVELAGKMRATDEELAAALAVLDGTATAEDEAVGRSNDRRKADSAARRPDRRAEEADGIEPEHVLTKVQYTDTDVRAAHADFLSAARWLDEAIARENAAQAGAPSPATRLENPLAGLLSDDRLQSVQPKGREAVIALMERIADGEEPKGDSEADPERVRQLIGELAAQLARDHRERPRDHLIYELN